MSEPLWTTEESRAFDAHWQGLGVPSLLLMENAGAGAAWALAAHYPDLRRREVVVLTGPGNNGGDGFVLARHLLAQGCRVTVLAATEPTALQGDARVAWQAWSACGVVEPLFPHGVARLAPAIAGGAVVVDALFGTGLRRPVEGAVAVLLDWLTTVKAEVVALDLPSGIDATTGEVLGAAARCRLTLTFGARKLGICSPEAWERVGELKVIPLGVPLEGAPAARAAWLTAATVAPWQPTRSRSGHKGSSGRVTLLAGAPGTIGAARLAARGALRGGAGLVRVLGAPETMERFESTTSEVMTGLLNAGSLERSLEAWLGREDVLVAGPGWGSSPLAKQALDWVVQNWVGPQVLDADALTQLALAPEQLRRAPGRFLLTPHHAEAARLLGCDVSAVARDTAGSACRLAERCGATVLLKGPVNVVADAGGTLWAVASGGPVLSSGGTGDVLAGLVGALACHLPLEKAAALGAYLHGRAGERWVERHGWMAGMLASEVADEFPAVSAELASLASASAQVLG